jgi:hypothetical protein
MCVFTKTRFRSRLRSEMGALWSIIPTKKIRSPVDACSSSRQATINFISAIGWKHAAKLPRLRRGAAPIRSAAEGHESFSGSRTQAASGPGGTESGLPRSLQRIYVLCVRRLRRSADQAKSPCSPGRPGKQIQIGALCVQTGPQSPQKKQFETSC